MTYRNYAKDINRIYKESTTQKEREELHALIKDAQERIKHPTPKGKETPAEYKKKMKDKVTKYKERLSMLGESYDIENELDSSEELVQEEDLIDSDEAIGIPYVIESCIEALEYIQKNIPNDGFLKSRFKALDAIYDRLQVMVERIEKQVRSTPPKEETEVNSV